MTEETNDEQLLHRLFDQVTEHLETRWEYFSLTATEKVSDLAGKMAGLFVIIIFGLLVLFFFTFGFSWWLGDYINNRAGGFALTGLIFIPLAWLLYRWITPFVRTKVIQSILQDNADENPRTHE